MRFRALRPAPAPPTEEFPVPLPPRLLAADQVAGRIALLDLPSGAEVAVLAGRHLAEHAGFLALPGDLAACVDDRAA